MEGAPLADDLEAVWTGSEVIVWGAAEDEAGDCEHRAGAFDPNTRTWRAIPLQGTPFERKWKPTTNELAKNLCQPPPRAWRGPLIWTGNELLVWDAIGAGGTQAGVYYPEDDRWRVIDVSGGPLPRWQAYWAWTGGELLVWGGRVPDGSIGRGVVTGGLYDLGTQTWRSMNSEDAPDGMNAAGRA